jgi:hypothetical protein
VEIIGKINRDDIRGGIANREKGKKGFWPMDETASCIRPLHIKEIFSYLILEKECLHKEVTSIG